MAEVMQAMRLRWPQAASFLAEEGDHGKKVTLAENVEAIRVIPRGTLT